MFSPMWHALTSMFRARRGYLVLVDLVLVALAWWLAFWLRFNLDVPAEFEDLALRSVLVSTGAYALALAMAGVWRPVWAYTGLPELRQLARGIAVGAGLTASAVLLFRLPNFPRSVLILHPLLVLVSLGAVRAAWRTLSENRTGRGGAGRIVVIGSLQEAADALGFLRGSRLWMTVGIVSPVSSEVGRSVQGVPVIATVSDLAQACRDVNAQTALIAGVPGAPSRREALLTAANAGISLLTPPRPEDWLQDDAHRPRRVELEDLLGREPVRLDVSALAELFSGRTVLITGAGGSIGSELCRQIARFGVGELVCIDMSEIAIYQLDQSLRRQHAGLRCHYYTANVRESDRIDALMAQHRPAVVLHAAAYKHVPIMEDLNEIEALRTNVLGTLHVARAAGRHGVERFVMVSTDKAVNPTNVMGASKRLAELVVQGVAAEFPPTHFVSVRFGNVLGSSGSVVPLFERQIAAGGPVTVTHPDIVRYFMTIPEAAQLVLQAGLMGRSGQIFVLDMGEPVRIADLARMMIRLSGRTEQEVPITYTGLRPGEKLYEELLASDESTEPTPHPKLRVAKSRPGPAVDVMGLEGWIVHAGPHPQPDALRQWLRAQLPEYAPLRP